MRWFIFLLLLSSKVLADEKVISFSEAISLTLNNNLELKKSVQILELKNSDFMLARSYVLPKLSFSLNKSFGFKEQNFDIDTLGFNLSVPIFDGKKLFEASAKHNQYLAAQAKKNHDTDALIHKMGILYIDALKLLAGKNIAKEAFEQNQQQLLVLEKKLEVGRARKLDLLRSQYLVSKAQSEFLEKEQSYLQKMSELSQHLLVGEPFSLSPFSIESTELSKNEAELLALAQDNQEFKSLRQDVLGLNQSLLAEKLDFLPKISFMADYGMDKYWSSSGRASNLRMLINIELPLFSGFSSLALLKNKHASLSIAELTLQQKEQESTFNVGLMLEELRRLELIKANTEQGLKAAIEAQASAERMFKEGEATSLEMIEANTNLFNAKTQASTTALELERLKLKLLFTVGKLKELSFREAS